VHRQSPFIKKMNFAEKLAYWNQRCGMHCYYARLHHHTSAAHYIYLVALVFHSSSVVLSDAAAVAV
jgi:hypothetical protein